MGSRGEVGLRGHARDQRNYIGARPRERALRGVGRSRDAGLGRARDFNYNFRLKNGHGGAWPPLSFCGSRAILRGPPTEDP
jgi:hypothetical protein